MEKVSGISASTWLEEQRDKYRAKGNEDRTVFDRFPRGKHHCLRVYQQLMYFVNDDAFLRVAATVSLEKYIEDWAAAFKRKKLSDWEISDVSLKIANFINTCH